MNDQSETVMTHFFAWLAALAAGVGLTTQDIAYLIFGFSGVMISLASYISGRMDARLTHKENKKRTQMFRVYLNRLETRLDEGQPAAVEVLSEALKKAGD